MKSAFIKFGGKFYDLDVFDTVYEPLEDSFLLNGAIPEFLCKKRVLDMCCGSGIQAIKASLAGADVVAADIDGEAIRNTIHNAKKHNLAIDAIKSDLFKNVKGAYDLILFNPPYVPGENEGLMGENAWVGGKDGRVLIDRFLADFRKYLNDGGQALIIISSKNHIKEELEETGWTEISSQSFFFETVYLMKFTK